MLKLRNPNQQEKTELASYVFDQIWMDAEDPSKEARDEVENAAIAVFDNYVSDSPGYADKIMIVVWRGGPQMYEVFIWRIGEIIPVAQDHQWQV